MKFKKKKLVRLINHVIKSDTEKRIQQTPIRVGKAYLFRYWIPTEEDLSTKIKIPLSIIAQAKPSKRAHTAKPLSSQDPDLA